jgi:predicted small lipoprotein YifL
VSAGAVRRLAALLLALCACGVKAPPRPPEPRPAAPAAPAPEKRP